MDGSDNAKLERLQVVLTDLLKHQLGESLGEVELALGRWRGGELGPFEAHAELLKHAARAEQLAARIAQSGPEKANAVLRDAFDANLIDSAEFVHLTGQAPHDVEPSPPLEQLHEEPPDKQSFVEELLADGAVLIHVDARVSDVSVPAGFQTDTRLVLRFGYGLSPAIHDLTVDDEGISGTLTFGGRPHRVIVPWQGVYAAVSEVSQQAMVWPDDVPPEVIDQMGRLSEEADPGERSSASGGRSAPAASRPSSSSARKKPTNPKRPRPSHLKLVD